jgi:tape measure domain-containing protein
MSTLGDLIVRVGANVSGFQDAMTSVLDRAEKTVKGVERQFASLDKLGTRLSGLGQNLTFALTLPIVGVGSAAVRSAMDMESLEKGLIAVAGSADAAKAQMVRLQEVAKLPGLGMSEAIKASINLQSAGMSAQTAERYVKAFGNALATVGKGKAELQGVIEQLRQMSSKAKVTADDLKPIMNATPQVAKIVKEAFGTIDTEQLQKMGVSTAMFLDVVVAGLEKLPPAGNSTKNTFENLSDAIQRASSSIGKNLLPLMNTLIPLVERAANTVGQWGEEFGKLDPATQSFSIALAGVLAVSPLVVTAIGSMASGVKGLAVAFTYLQGLGAFKMLFSPVGLTILTAMAATAVVLKELKNLDSLGKAGTDRVYAEATKKAQADEKMMLAESEAAWKTHDAAIAKSDQERIQKQLAGLATTKDKHEKEVQFAQKKLSLSLEERASLDLTGERYKSAEQWIYNYYRTKALDKQLTQELVEIGAGLRTALSDQTAEYAKQIEPLDQVAERLESLNRAAQSLSEIKVSDGLKVSYDKATEAMLKYQDRLSDLGVKTDEIMRASKEKVKDAMLSTIAAYQSGAISLDEFKRVYADLLKLYNTKPGSGSSQQKTVLTEISTVLTNMNQDIADAIVNWKGFGDTAMNVLKQIGKAIIANILEKMVLTSGRLDAITGALGAGLKKIGLGSLVGGATKAADIGSTAAQTASSAASSSSGALGAIGGIGGAVNMVSGVVSAIGSLGSMFMMGKMNSKLFQIQSSMVGLVGNSTGLNEQINEYLPALKGIEERIKQLITGGLGIYSFPDSEVRVRMADSSLVGVGGQMVVNVSGGYFMTDGALDSFIDTFITRLRQRGLKV